VPVQVAAARFVCVCLGGWCWRCTWRCTWRDDDRATCARACGGPAAGMTSQDACRAAATQSAPSPPLPCHLLWSLFVISPADDGILHHIGQSRKWRVRVFLSRSRPDALQHRSFQVPKVCTLTVRDSTLSIYSLPAFVMPPKKVLADGQPLPTPLPISLLFLQSTPTHTLSAASPHKPIQWHLKHC